MPTAITNNMPTMGDTGESPSSGFSYNALQQVNEKHFNYLWDQFEKFIDSTISEFNSELIRVDGTIAMNADIDMGGNAVVNTTTQVIEEANVDRLVYNHTMPRYDEVGDDAEGTRDAMTRIFDVSLWRDPQFVTGTAHGAGQFVGGCLVPSGDVIMAPFATSNVGIYDPTTDTYTSGAAHGEGGSAFAGAVLVPDGTVVFVPRQSANVGLYDPVTDTYTSGPTHAASGTPIWEGGTLAPNGTVIFAPASYSNVGIYDPDANTYSDGDTHGEGVGAFRGAVLAPNGNIIFVPRNSSNVGIYDPVTDTYTSGTAHGEGSNAFAGGALVPDGRVVFAPNNSSNVGIYDPDTDTYTSGPAHGEGSEAFWGATLGPDGRVYFAPRSASGVGVFDPSDDSFTTISHGVGSPFLEWNSIVLTPNGRIVLIPDSNANMALLRTDAETQNPRSTALHPLVNGSV